MRKMLVSEVFDRHGIKRCPFRSPSSSRWSAGARGCPLRTPLVRPSSDLSLQNAGAACTSISTLPLSSARAALTSRSATYAMGGEWDACPSLAVIITLQPCSGRVFLCVNSRLTNSGYFAVVAGETPFPNYYFSFLSFTLLCGIFSAKTPRFRDITRGFQEF